MTGSYRIHEFAELTGVTVKALHHYDRLGLLKPRRTGSGYRVYADEDLERLEQIVALKFVGLPLRQIRTLLDRGSPSLPDALRLQRRVLEEKRRQIDRAIEAIDVAEKGMAESGSSVPALQRLIGVITMEQSAELLKNYFGDASWSQWKTRRAGDAAREWHDLLHDIQAALDEDPASPRAQALADRWVALVETEVGGDPSVRTGLIKAWVDGHRLPALLDRTIVDADVATATRFISEVLWARSDAEQRARPPAVSPRASDSRVALFRRAEALVDGDPAAPDAQALVRNWDELLEREAGGDAETIRTMRASLASRKSWPDGMRRYVASLYATTPEAWERVIDFIERARASGADR